MAPEYLNKGIVTIKADIFSLGVIIIQIIAGHKNYPDGTGICTQDFIGHVRIHMRNILFYALEAHYVLFSFLHSIILALKLYLHRYLKTGGTGSRNLSIHQQKRIVNK
jgi:hypothetical protein